MKYPDVEDIEILHAELIEVTGGAHGIRDRGLLESAVSQPSSSFGGIELYETIDDKTTALCYSMAMNHPFVDGNKRIAHAAALMFLRMNGYTLTGNVEEHEHIILSLAASNLTREELLDWFRKRIVAP